MSIEDFQPSPKRRYSLDINDIKKSTYNNSFGTIISFNKQFSYRISINFEIYFIHCEKADKPGTVTPEDDGSSNTD